MKLIQIYSSYSMEDNGFTLVTGKKKTFKTTKEHKIMSPPYELTTGYSVEELKEKINKCYIEILESSFVKEINLIIEKLKYFQLQGIVCYALGKLDSSHCQAPKYQLAVLIYIKRVLKIEQVLVYDPVLTEVEITAINEYGIGNISVNEEGKRKVEIKTLFVIFHGEKFLFENLIISNLYSKSDVIIFGNDLKKMFDTNSVFLDNLHTIPLVNNFYRETIFDCCALQWFD